MSLSYPILYSLQKNNTNCYQTSFDAANIYTQQLTLCRYLQMLLTDLITVPAAHQAPHTCQFTACVSMS